MLNKDMVTWSNYFTGVLEYNIHGVQVKKKTLLFRQEVPPVLALSTEAIVTPPLKGISMATLIKTKQV